MTWTPIDEENLKTLIADAVANMDQPVRQLWSLICINPAKWSLSPWGDLGGGFWVVGVLGERVIWFNDIEWGFNVSHYGKYGVIRDYWCNQDELQHLLYFLLQEPGEGEEGRFGPPVPLE